MTASPAATISPLNPSHLPLLHESLTPPSPTSNDANAHIRALCQQIYFRQSLMKDYLGCPQRTLYRWVAGFQEDSITMAAYLGTAGHKVIYDWHSQRLGDVTQSWIMETFEAAFWAELTKRNLQPSIRPGCDSIRDQLHEDMPYYVEIIEQYTKNKRNQGFHTTLHEQSFVLVVQHPNVIAFLKQCDHTPESPVAELDFDTWKQQRLAALLSLHPPYLFTGQLDQAGYYDDGTFVLRDIKFRDNAFKPSRKELGLDSQFTTYAAALKWGVPACDNCKPTYEQEQFSSARKLKYNGPCPACVAKIGTVQWPLKYPERCEMVWMYDYETYKKDQYTKEITDHDAPKVPSPTSGRKVLAKKINPEWVTGYKKGDPKGEGLLTTYRTPASLDVLLGDLLRVCDDIRAARFYRRPSKDCNWCPHSEVCSTSLKIQIQDLDYSKIQTFGTEDPF
jgi:hypothetical protein